MAKNNPIKYQLNAIKDFLKRSAGKIKGGISDYRRKKQEEYDARMEREARENIKRLRFWGHDNFADNMEEEIFGQKKKKSR